MKITIIQAAMSRHDGDGYRGSVLFEAEGHSQPYEVTLSSKDGGMWDYSLSFGRESGPEEEILVVEQALEEDDELFDLLVEAAEGSMD